MKKWSNKTKAGKQIKKPVVPYYHDFYGNQKLNAVKLSPIRLFCVVSLICFCILFFCFFLSRGTLIARYFFHDTRDTGMDFFHSIEYVRGRAPYEKFSTLYPPLANLLFYVIYRLIPLDVSNMWAPTYESSVKARGTEIDLRTWQAPMLMFILAVILSVWIIITLVQAILRHNSRAEANWTALCLLISPGMLYAFERGNILFIIVPLILFFVKYRNSENQIIRELSLISLAIAAGLKLYPAFLGVLLLKDKQYKAAIRAIIYGILSVVLPMLVFVEGLPGIISWLQIMFSFGKSSQTPWIGYGFANILHRVAEYLERFLGIEIQRGWFSYSGWIIAGIMLLLAIFSQKTWKSILLITMSVLMYQSQGAYVFSMMCVPMIFFLEEESKLTPDNCIPFILMTALLVNVPVFHTRSLMGTYVSTHDVLLRQGICLLLVFWCIITSLIDWTREYKMKDRD